MIFAHTYLGGAVAARIKKRFQIPYVVVLHFSGLLNETIRPYHVRFVEEALRGANRIICVSHALKEFIQVRWSYDTEVVPNFIDHKIFSPREEKIETNKTIVFVGDLIERKRVDLLIQAFARVRASGQPVRLLVIGDGPKRKKLIHLARILNLSEYIIFAGRQEQIKVAAFLAKASLLVLPSSHESFGIVLVEALLCGLPVIATDNGGCRDIIRDYNGLIDHHATEESLARTIEHVLLNLDTFDAENIRKRALQEFSVQAVAPKLSELFTSVTGS